MSSPASRSPLPAAVRNLLYANFSTCVSLCTPACVSPYVTTHLKLLTSTKPLGFSLPHPLLSHEGGWRKDILSGGVPGTRGLRKMLHRHLESFTPRSTAETCEIGLGATLWLTQRVNLKFCLDSCKAPRLFFAIIATSRSLVRGSVGSHFAGPYGTVLMWPN